MTTAEVASLLRGYRFAYVSEARLQEGIAAALEEHGLAPEREVRLGEHGRIDLLVGRVGIEVKVAGSASAVARQLGRYLRSDRLDGLVLVTGRVRHIRLQEIDGKPVEVVTLAVGGL